MSHIVDTLRKHQKLIVLGVALAVVTLYMVPLDQIAFAGPRADAAEARFQAQIASLNARALAAQNPQAAAALSNTADHLTEVQYRIVQILESHGL